MERHALSSGVVGNVLDNVAKLDVIARPLFQLLAHLVLGLADMYGDSARFVQRLLMYGQAQGWNAGTNASAAAPNKRINKDLSMNFVFG